MILRTVRSGFTLVEMSLYIVLTSILMVAVMRSTITLLRNDETTTSRGAVQQQLRVIMEQIMQDIRAADSVSSTGSVFLNSNGALALNFTDEFISPTVYKVINAKVYKRQGAGIWHEISSDEVNVTKLHFEKMTDGSTPTIAVTIDGTDNYEAEGVLTRNKVTLRSLVNIREGFAQADPRYIFGVDFYSSASNNPIFSISSFAGSSVSSSSSSVTSSVVSSAGSSTPPASSTSSVVSSYASSPCSSSSIPIASASSIIVSSSSAPIANKPSEDAVLTALLLAAGSSSSTPIASSSSAPIASASSIIVSSSSAPIASASWSSDPCASVGSVASSSSSSSVALCPSGYECSTDTDCSTYTGGIGESCGTGKVCCGTNSNTCSQYVQGCSGESTGCYEGYCTDVDSVGSCSCGAPANCCAFEDTLDVVLNSTDCPLLNGKTFSVYKVANLDPNQPYPDGWSGSLVYVDGADTHVMQANIFNNCAENWSLNVECYSNGYSTLDDTFYMDTLQCSTGDNIARGGMQFTTACGCGGTDYIDVFLMTH